MMINKIKTKEVSISVVGLGYVGLPLAVAFAAKGVNVIGFDVSESKIQAYKNGIDVTCEVGNERLKHVKNLDFSCNPADLQKAVVHLVAVPTPVLDNNTPDLSLVESAARIVGKNMKKGSVVVFESTVYPGITEDFCMPILEKESGFKAGVDFKIGYSPERINPGDKKHRLENIVKVTSGMDDESAQFIGDLYSLIIDAGVHRAPSIKVAEAAKVIENAQRDINIAFVNELSLIFDRLHINTLDVLEAAGTKWNFLNFKPGLVGGHCISVDPYYLASLADKLGYHAQVILAGRRINDEMGKFIAEKTVKKLIHSQKQVKGATVLLMGLTFKEDCPDLRNSKVVDIYNELKDYGVNVLVTDPIACKIAAKKEYNIDLVALDTVKNVDAIVLCVAHSAYKTLDAHRLKLHYDTLCDTPILLDIKGVVPKNDQKKFNYWQL